MELAGSPVSKERERESSEEWKLSKEAKEAVMSRSTRKDERPRRKK